MNITKQLNTAVVTMAMLLSNSQLFAADDTFVFYQSTIPGTEKREQQQDFSKGFRNTSYCEIMPVFEDKANDRLVTEAYNTFSYNDCPAELWDKVDVEAMMEKYGAIKVIMNGPRYWVLDGMAVGDESPYREHVKIQSFIPGMQAQLGAQISGDNFGEQTYTVQNVRRWTTWMYKAGNEVYELTDDQGNVYIMQSYLDSSGLKIDDLAKLGEKLKLPEGWSFKARTIDEDYALVSSGDAYVIQDDLKNSYQRKN